MPRLLCAAAAALVLTVIAGTPASAYMLKNQWATSDGSRSAYQDLTGERSAFSYQEEPSSGPSGLPSARENFDVVSELNLVHPVTGPVELGQIADVTVHKGYAYVNSWDDPNCQHGGAFVVDIRNPASPQQIHFIAAQQPYYFGEGAHAVAVATPQFTGDILAVNLETYGSNVPGTCSDELDKTRGGFNLYNVSDPANPVPLALGAGDRDDDNDPATPDALAANSYHSVFVWQDGARAYLVASDNTEFTDVDVFDITDPAAPEHMGDWDLLEMFPQIAEGENANGGSIFNHDMIVKRIGDRQVMAVSYWDAGYVQLDVTDPRNPTYIDDTTYAEAVDPVYPDPGLSPEGNAHYSEFSHDNQFLLAADEDFNTSRVIARATEGPTAGNRATGNQPGGPQPRITDLPDQRMNGPSTFVGRACTADSVPAAPADDGDPNTEAIALVERGDCDFVVKWENVQDKGWDAIVVFNNPRPDDSLINPAADNATIPIVQIRRFEAIGPQGILDPEEPPPAAGTAGPPLDVAAVFDGWGYAHLYDAATGERIDSFGIPEGHDPRYETGFGDLSIHEVATDPTEPLAYSAYYAGGMRVLQFSRENGLVETAKFIDEGGSNFWGVEQFTTSEGERLIAGSDRDKGLFILRYTGPGAAQRPACQDVTVTTDRNTPVSVPLTCSDANGNPLTLSIVGQPQHGTLSGISGSSVTYTPETGFTGTDEFTYRAFDGAANSALATATINVIGECGPEILGTAAGEVLNGTAFQDTIRGGGGDDTIGALQGDDCVYGDAGDDRITAGAGHDLVDGGAGEDRQFGDAGRDRMRGRAGNDRVRGSRGKDVLKGDKNNDNLTGGQGSDRLSGGSGNDSLQGNAGSDKIRTGSGSNVVGGGADDDRIRARNGSRDKIRCGLGRDVVRADDEDRVHRSCERVRRS